MKRDTMIRVFDSSRILLGVCAAAEGLTMMQFLENLLRQYVVERDLTEATADLLAHRQAIVEKREAELKRLRKSIREELLQEEGKEDVTQY